MPLRTECIGEIFAHKWEGCAMGNDGCLYAMPIRATRILKVDPTDDSTTFVGPHLKTNGYTRCIAGPDGIMYGLPSYGRYMLRYIPATKEVTMVGDLKEQYYYCGAFASNGILYLLPRSGKILRYDPVNDSTSLIGDELPAHEGWCDVVLAGDGYFYFIPYSATRVIRFDTADESITFIGDEFIGDYKWGCGVLGPDGNVYGISYHHNRILKIDIATQSTSLVGPDLGEDEDKFMGGVVGHDGCIYMMPYYAEFVVRYNIVTGVTSNVSERLGDLGEIYAGKYVGGVLAPNGYIYTPPYAGKQVMKIKSWSNWVYLKPRLLVEKRRATRKIIQFDNELTIVQHFIIHVNDDIFRTVMEML